jgi:diguanylate cyclase (GGDEF)-like protein/PAS domain S-box-containing protein
LSRINAQSHARAENPAWLIRAPRTAACAAPLPGERSNGEGADRLSSMARETELTESAPLPEAPVGADEDRSAGRDIGSPDRAATIVAGIYLVVALAWIWASDSLLAALVSADEWVAVGRLKGIVFVVVTAAVLYGLVYRQTDRIIAVHRALLGRKREFRQLFEGAPYPMWVYDVRTRAFLAVNEAALRQYGYRRDEFLTMTTDALAPAVPGAQCGRDTDGDAARFVRHVHKDGRVREVTVSESTTVFDGRAARVVTIEDVTDKRAVEEQQRLALAAFATTTDGVVITDADLAIIAVNPAFTRITGYTGQEVMGKTPIDVHGNSEGFARVLAELETSGHWEGEMPQRRKDGSPFPAWMAVTLTRDAAGKPTHSIAFIRDISDQKRAEQAIRDLAYFDALTALPNRRLLEDRIHHMQAHHHRHGLQFSLLFVDVDNFKAVNDSLGYVCGDAVLRHVAGCLRRAVRESDTVARWGGDEFVVVLEETGAEGAAKVADKIAKSLSEPCVFEGRVATVGACVGIAIYPQDGDECTQLLSSAGSALHFAKHAGRNSRHFFHADLNVEARARLELEEALRNALTGGELSLHFQPQADLQTGQLTAVETLVRWTHPELGPVPPSRFIPVAESLGLIDAMGRWILTEACRAGRRWVDAGLGTPVSVNLSVLQLRNDRFVEDVETVLRETGLPPSLLEFEVTEGLLLQWNERTLAQFRHLAELGVRLAIDDFGTGYSSLAYLCRLPVSTLKIDRSFVHHLAQGDKGRAVLQAVIAVGRNLGLRVVAEGVETAEQAERLRDLQCAEMQGYWLARPMSEADLIAWRAARGSAVGPLAPAP